MYTGSAQLKARVFLLLKSSLLQSVAQFSQSNKIASPTRPLCMWIKTTNEGETMHGISYPISSSPAVASVETGN